MFQKRSNRIDFQLKRCTLISPSKAYFPFLSNLSSIMSCYYKLLYVFISCLINKKGFLINISKDYHFNDNPFKSWSLSSRSESLIPICQTQLHICAIAGFFNDQKEFSIRLLNHHYLIDKLWKIWSLSLRSINLIPHSVKLSL